ncbi:MAG TPA: DUF4381 domain-containing protein [Casimicrobiaceae bacterium]|nr:DUF4381 domain-containing protein [Casimicrobiaceae bacterium]
MTNQAGPTLHDIHLPPPPGWWPPAPGWWLLAASCAVCCIVAFYILRKMRRRRRIRRDVLRELERCIAEARGEPATLAAALSAFLRRMALRETPAAAAYADERWLAYLDARLGGDEFARGIGRALLEAPFRPAPAYDAPALVALVRRWTRKALETERSHA